MLAWQALAILFKLYMLSLPLRQSSNFFRISLFCAFWIFD